MLDILACNLLTESHVTILNYPFKWTVNVLGTQKLKYVMNVR